LLCLTEGADVEDPRIAGGAQFHSRDRAAPTALAMNQQHPSRREEAQTLLPERDQSLPRNVPTGWGMINSAYYRLGLARVTAKFLGPIQRPLSLLRLSSRRLLRFRGLMRAGNPGKSHFICGAGSCLLRGRRLRYKITMRYFAKNRPCSVIQKTRSATAVQRRVVRCAHRKAIAYHLRSPRIGTTLPIAFGADAGWKR
jgi:hypothetical protein